MSTREVRDVLLAMADTSGGIITPEGLVKAAQSRSHPLHDRFEWDNKVAGHAFRIEQARRLIRGVTFNVVRREISLAVPVFIRNPESKPLQGYATIGRIRSKEDVAREAMRDEMQRVMAALRRAQAIADALDLTDEVESLMLNVSSFLHQAGIIMQGRDMPPPMMS